MENEAIYEEIDKPVEEVIEEDPGQIVVDDSGSSDSNSVIDDNTVSETLCH